MNCTQRFYLSLLSLYLSVCIKFLWFHAQFHLLAFYSMSQECKILLKNMWPVLKSWALVESSFSIWYNFRNLLFKIKKMYTVWVLHLLTQCKRTWLFIRFHFLNKAVISITQTEAYLFQIKACVSYILVTVLSSYSNTRFL